ncbi:MAG: hypothetical protein RL328_1323 [Acidobacteriota bacterium]|jgi:hypothetical protein
MPTDSNLEIKLRDGKKLNGKLVSAGEAVFELRPPKGRLGSRRPAIVAIPYSDVQTVKRHRLSPTEVGLIASAVTVAGVMIIVAVVVSKAEGW